MKIAQVCNYVAPAKDSMGTERVVERLTKGLLQRGHSVQMVCASGSICPVEGAEITQRISNDVDFVHYHAWEPDIFTKTPYPWAATIHAATPYKQKELAVRNPHVIAVSRFAAKSMEANQHVWNCADPDEFVFEDQKDDYFVWIGGTDWGEEKGVFSAIDFAKLFKFKLKIAGTGKNKYIIQGITADCKGTNNIEYLGAVNGQAKVKLLQKARALLLFTRLEDACPVSITEAMMCGTPVIGSTNGALPEMILNNVTGFTCDTFYDVVCAFKKIDRISPRTCRDFAMTHFSIDACARHHEFIYKRIIQMENKSQESTYAS